jgi:hypothetical protein
MPQPRQNLPAGVTLFIIALKAIVHIKFPRTQPDNINAKIEQKLL